MKNLIAWLAFALLYGRRDDDYASLMEQYNRQNRRLRSTGLGRALDPRARLVPAVYRPPRRIHRGRRRF